MPDISIDELIERMERLNLHNDTSSEAGEVFGVWGSAKLPRPRSSPLLADTSLASFHSLADNCITEDHTMTDMSIDQAGVHGDLNDTHHFQDAIVPSGMYQHYVVQSPSHVTLKVG